MSDQDRNQAEEASASKDAEADTGPEQHEQRSARNGPTFTETPDPLAGVKKSAADALASMEGKTVSMKVYVGTIIGVVVLMLLARCGG